MVSPLGVALGSITGDGLFMSIAALMCLSLLPVAATITEEPRMPSSVGIDIPGLFVVAPSAVVGAFAVGLVNGPVLALAPVYGVGIGLRADLAAALLLALQGGSLLFQWPLGWLSDHVDRRVVIAGLAAATAAASVLIMGLDAQTPAWRVLLAFVLWGGFALCIYAVCVAHACDLVDPGRIVPTISTLLVCWASGVMIGPIPGAILMQRVGGSGLFLFSTVVTLLLAVFVALRMIWRRRSASKGGFVDLAPISAATSSLSPRAHQSEPPPPRPAEAL
jgi:MFS family permease